MDALHATVLGMAAQVGGEPDGPADVPAELMRRWRDRGIRILERNRPDASAGVLDGGFFGGFATG
jgi:hypothetical protein